MEGGRRQAERKSVSLLVTLKHQNVATFEEEFATNLSEGGMFIRSRTPQPVGTHLKFEVQLAGGQRVMRGTAVVRWIRLPGDPEGGPGMGVQFEQLDDATRALVDRMLKARAPAAPPPAQASLPPEVAALEAELRARYGESPAVGGSRSALPQVAAVTPPIAPAVAPIIPPVAPAVAPVVPPVAPAVAPVVPPIAPATPVASAAPAASTAADDLFSGLPPELDPAFVNPSSSELPPELDLAFATPPAPARDAVEIPIEALVADTPAPNEEEIPIELDTGTGDSGIELDIPILDLDAGAADEGVELDLDIADAPPLPPAGASSPAQVAEPSAESKAPAQASALPEVRRVAPPEPPAVTTPTLLKPEPAAPPPKPKAGPVFLTPPEKLLETGPVIGIDLGTTNSCVAILQGARPTVIRSKEGYNTLPSLVTLSSQGKVQIAHRAKSNLIMNPSQTIYGAKRLVGRPYDSAVVRQVRERFHYEVVPDDHGRAAVRLGPHVLSLEEVQGLILKECRELAEQYLGQPVGRAVITVPAYYSEPQREAVRRAGWLAGLKVERILNEPTAAALAFGLNKDLDKKILVYDLGGGTFDATLLKIEKNVFEVLATGGDVFLGGIDFDNLIVDYLLEEFQKREGIPFQGDQVALSRVSEAAEKAKVALSERTTYDIHIPMLMMDAQMKPRDLRATLDRKRLEALAEPLVDRTLDTVRDVLLDANVKAKDVDEIILVGGMSRMPLVREKLKALMGKSPHAGVNADEAVALGAALYCGTVDKVSSVTLIDVLPMTVGVGLPGGAFKRVIERNTPLPAQRSFAVSTARDNETSIELSIFQGEDSNIAGNEYLGTVRIEGLPKMPKGVVQVAVTLRLDAECVLHAEALEMKTHKKVVATLATRYTSEEVQRKLGISAEKAAQVEAARAKELQSRGGGFWGFLKRVVGRK
ncbi:MAG: TIGR02266 family protein [Myxococcaceae bacterium]|nr:TIGR02266 family protein [Myxococcaceae bacterium]